MKFEVVLLFSLFFTAICTQPKASVTPESQNSSYWRKDHTMFSNYTSEVLYSSSKSFCVSNQPIQCPLWAYCDNTDGTCKWKNTDAIVMDLEGNHTFILSCYCLTNNAVMNTTEVGLCLYNCDYMGKSKSEIYLDYSLLSYNYSSLDYTMCGKYNRTGTLCGKCINNTFMQVYSYNMSCISCGSSFSNWIKYIVIVYIPLTLFCAVIMMLRINIPSSQIQGYVFFCQILSCPIFARTIFIYLGVRENSGHFKMAQLLGTLYGIWNLDFFRLLNLGICFQVNPLTNLSLDFAVAVYPLLLIVLTYVLTLLHDSNFRPVVKISKPFKAIFSIFVTNWDIKTSTIDAFATFLYLSNVKFLSVCFDLLVPVQVCDTSGNGSCKWAVFYDATVPYLSHVHLPYAILAMFVLLLFVIGPILILIIYPFLVCQKCLVLIPRRWQLALYVFVDSYQGCYKDGTEPGTRDCRWFSAVPFLVRFIIFSVYGAVILSPFLAYCIVILVFTAALIIIVDPYKPQFKNYSNHLIVFILFLACTVTCALGMKCTSYVKTILFMVTCVIGLLNLFYISILILNWIISHRKIGCKKNSSN